MRKTLTSLLILLIVICVGVSLVKNTAIKIAVQKGVDMVTGLNLRIGSLNIGIIRTLVDIKDLKLYNPSGFDDRIMLDMPRVYVDYDLGALLKHNIHLTSVILDMKEFVVVKKKDGKLNLDALKAVQQSKSPAPKTEESAETKKTGGKMPSIRIDNLQLKIGKVIYKDYSKGGKPEVREFDINIDEKYHNVNDPVKLVNLIVIRALMNTTIGRLADFDIGPLKNGLGKTLAGAQKVLESVNAGEVGQAVTDTTKDVKETVAASAGALKESANAAKDTLKNTANDLKNLFKLPSKDKN